MLARAPGRRAIGKMLLAGALRRSVCREAALRRRGCAEEFPSPREMSLHGLPPLRISRLGTHHMGTQRGERTTWERTVRRILFAGFEALCVFGYLELVYHLLNLTIHKDRKVVG